MTQAFALSAATACMVPAACAQTQADPPGRVGRIAESSGLVRSFEADAGWVGVLRNQPISTGDRIATEHDGRALVQVGSSWVRLGPDSELVVARLDDERVRLRLDHGVLALSMRSPEVVGQFAIETVDGFFVPLQPSFLRVDIAAGHTLGTVWSGKVQFQGRDRTGMNLLAGQAAQLWREGAAQALHYRSIAPSVDDFARLAQADARRADQDARAKPPPGLEEVDGIDELRRYGRWESSDVQGPLWVPTVPADWAPYHAGRWAWVPPWGWTWIDDTPWGFAPFHYGRWLRQGGRWAWTPRAATGGQDPGRPAYAPALVGWIGWIGGPGPNASAPSGDAPSSALGWVPLAPSEPFYPAYAVSPSRWRGINGSMAYPAVGPALAAASPSPLRFVPTGPVSYANRNAPHAVTVLPMGQLSSRQALPVAKTSARDLLAAQAAAGRARILSAPPPPAGRGALSPGAPVVDIAAGPVSSRASSSALSLADDPGRRRTLPMPPPASASPADRQRSR